MKTDLIKKFKSYYQAPRNPELDSFDSGHYLTIEGMGEPGGKDFTQKVEALYPTAYGVKKICKGRKQDFGVPKLEGHWWVGENKDARTIDRKEWKWKLLIRMPEFVTKEDVAIAKETVIKTKKLALVAQIKFETLNNGKCVHVQVDFLHEVFLRYRRR